MQQSMQKALAGVRVVEYCHMVAGPYCSKLLADLGAEVIKIEPPQGEEARRRGPFFADIPDSERSGLFLYLNTNKRGITLNLNSASGRRVLRKLVQQADILVEDCAPAMAGKLGLDYSSLAKANEKLVMTSITPFGLTGPYKDLKAYPLNSSHGGGEGYLLPGGNVSAGRAPVIAGRYVAEYCAGLNAAVGTLGALYWLGAGGKGQLVDVSKQESIMSLYRPDMTRYINQELEVNRADQGYVVGGIMPCQDGYAAVITPYANEWKKFVKFMGDPAWAKEDRFKDTASLAKNGEEANAYIVEFFMEHTKDELYHRGQGQGVAMGMVCNAADLLNAGQLKARNFFVDIDHPETGRVTYPSVSYKMSKTPWGIERPAPLLGQHNEEVYSHLGYSRADLVRMKGTGVI